MNNNNNNNNGNKRTSCGSKFPSVACDLGDLTLWTKNPDRAEPVKMQDVSAKNWRNTKLVRKRISLRAFLFCARNPLNHLKCSISVLFSCYPWSLTRFTPSDKKTQSCCTMPSLCELTCMLRCIRLCKLLHRALENASCAWCDDCQSRAYTQFAFLDSRLFGPNPLKVLRHYLWTKRFLGNPTLDENLGTRNLAMRTGCTLVVSEAGSLGGGGGLTRQRGHVADLLDRLGYVCICIYICTYIYIYIHNHYYY